MRAFRRQHINLLKKFCLLESGSTHIRNEIYLSWRSQTHMICVLYYTAAQKLLILSPYTLKNSTFETLLCVCV